MSPITDVGSDSSPSREECEAALERVTQSIVFKPAPRLTAFLRFVVEATLGGRADTIKAYTVAVGALGRSADFDPATDASVRVEAGRLRNALARYYDDSQDPVVIDLPRGRYVPEFSRRSTTTVLTVGETIVEAAVRSDSRATRQEYTASCSELSATRQQHAALHAEVRAARQLLSQNMAALRVTVKHVHSATAELRTPADKPK